MEDQVNRLAELLKLEPNNRKLELEYLKECERQGREAVAVPKFIENKYLLRNFRHINDFYFSDTHYTFTKKLNLSVHISPLTNLTELEIGASIDSEIFANLSHLKAPELKYLKLNYIYPKHNMVEVISKIDMPKLEKFFFPNMSSDFVLNFLKIIMNKKYSYLKEVHISKSTGAFPIRGHYQRLQQSKIIRKNGMYLYDSTDFYKQYDILFDNLINNYKELRVNGIKIVNMLTT
jgi:hypothetical protein